jgi:malate dehydrogenase (oxaloacetate-decarboxylating)(NADP+)
MNKGRSILLDGAINRSVEFTREERRTLGLEGLLPYAVATQQLQVDRVMEGLRRKENDLERYILLNSLQDRNERLFYRVLVRPHRADHADDLHPHRRLACQEFRTSSAAQGLYITPDYRGRIAECSPTGPSDDVRVIVVTDGERILGLGDLGANGMGIPIGKLALYTACAGIQPAPVPAHHLGRGHRQRGPAQRPLLPRPGPMRASRGDAYDRWSTSSCRRAGRFPKALIQFEDFATANAYRLLDQYRDRVCCFNDDIQGTAAVALAGVYASTCASPASRSRTSACSSSAREAATGIAELI